ncbi:MAG: type III PLP-dependent enzyme [Pseudomonadota bacterium]
MDAFSAPSALISSQKPTDPVLLYRPHRLAAAAKWFTERFPARPYYAVKANPAPHILKGLWDAGLRQFDVASIGEVRAVRALFPDAELAFLHPVKAGPAIEEAYQDHRVCTFVLDSQAEFDKIMRETGEAEDLTLLVRIHVSNAGAVKPLAGKFGASATQAPALLRAVRTRAARLGVSFHVGSQALNPEAWSRAMGDLSALITEAGVIADIVDVGGGFPGCYAMDRPPPMDAYAARIASAFETMPVLENAELWCEPGRALVAEAESLLCRVDGVKCGAVYLNDGAFGALYDVSHERWAFPYRCFRADGQPLDAACTPKIVYGPTCDSADRFPDLLPLPEDLGEGDYIEFGNLGAYGRSIAGGFNGFGRYETCRVRDSAWATAFPAAGPAERVTIGSQGRDFG